MKLSDFIADLEMLRAKHGDDIEVTVSDMRYSYVPASSRLTAHTFGVVVRREIQLKPTNEGERHDRY